LLKTQIGQDGLTVDKPVEGAHGVDGVAAPVVDVAVVGPLEEDVFEVVVGGEFPGDEAGFEVAVDVCEVVCEVAGCRFIFRWVSGCGVEEGDIGGIFSEDVSEVIENYLPLVVGEAQFVGDIS